MSHTASIDGSGDFYKRMAIVSVGHQVRKKGCYRSRVFQRDCCGLDDLVVVM
jgi:hypothetical protein